jgi:hypothetical protein
MFLSLQGTSTGTDLEARTATHPGPRHAQHCKESIASESLWWPLSFIQVAMCAC